MKKKCEIMIYLKIDLEICENVKRNLLSQLDKSRS